MINQQAKLRQYKVSEAQRLVGTPKNPTSCVMPNFYHRLGSTCGLNPIDLVVAVSRPAAAIAVRAAEVHAAVGAHEHISEPTEPVLEPNGARFARF